MALIGNKSLINRTPIRQFATGTLSGYSDCLNPTSSLRNCFFGGYDKKSSIPNGYAEPSSWVIQQKAGGLASYRQLSGSISSTQNLVKGVNLLGNTFSASMSETTIALSLIVTFAASMSGEVAWSPPTLRLILEAQAAMSAGITENIDLSAIIDLAANLTASITNDLTLMGLAHLSADIVPYTELSPQSLARAVWNEQMGGYNEVGTFGYGVQNLAGGATPETIAEAVRTELTPELEKIDAIKINTDLIPATI